MKIITVVAALLKNEGKYLIGCRSTGKFQGFWEFPGGKVENNEDYEVALKREILEEFGIDIEIEKFLFKIKHNYPDFILEMYCFLVLISTNQFVLNDHSEIMWFDPKEKQNIKWLPADIKVVEKLRAINF